MGDKDSQSKKGFSDLLSSALPKGLRLGTMVLAGLLSTGLNPAITSVSATTAPLQYIKKEDGEEEVTLAPLVLEPGSSAGWQLAAHRSHRSHQSHRSHRSSYSGGSGYSSAYSPPSQVAPYQAPPAVPVFPTATPSVFAPPVADMQLPEMPKPAPTTGIVTAIVNERTILLESGEHITLRGTASADGQEAEAKQTLEYMLKDKPVQLSYSNEAAKGKSLEAYVFAKMAMDGKPETTYSANLTLIQMGLLLWDPSQSVLRQDLFRDAQQRATINHRGFWKTSLKSEDAPTTSLLGVNDNGKQ